MSAPPDGTAPRVGPYELLKRIGKGGMASVYLARRSGEAGFTRVYALKVMHPNLSDQRDLVEMLMDEARLASRLAHPNVVATLDLGVDEGRYYLAMEYVEGVALDRLLRQHPSRRPPEILVPIAIEALEGLAAAHALCDASGRPLELVHRDVTPGNLIVGLDGRTRIADFGVAKARARLTKTMPGTVKGKAGYIAPEVALGRPIDGRADVFSMGVLLFNALTGETLFDTDDLALSIRQLVTKEVPPPSTVGLCPPPIFDQPILAALRREPADRHPSAPEMAEALRDALEMYAGPPDAKRVAEWVGATFGPIIEERRRLASTEPMTDSIDDVPDAPFSTTDDELDVPALQSAFLASEDAIEEDAPTRVASPAAPRGSFEAPTTPAPTSVAPGPADDPDEPEEEAVGPIRAMMLGLTVGVLVLSIAAASWIGWTIWREREAAREAPMRAVPLE